MKDWTENENGVTIWHGRGQYMPQIPWRNVYFWETEREDVIPKRIKVTGVPSPNEAKRLEAEGREIGAFSPYDVSRVDQEVQYKKGLKVTEDLVFHKTCSVVLSKAYAVNKRGDRYNPDTVSYKNMKHYRWISRREVTIGPMPVAMAKGIVKILGSLGKGIKAQMSLDLEAGADITLEEFEKLDTQDIIFKLSFEGEEAAREKAQEAAEAEEQRRRVEAEAAALAQRIEESRRTVEEAFGESVDNFSDEEILELAAEL